MNSLLLTFNSGEISPHLRFRLDLEKHLGAASTLENFLALPYGSITKRPGLRWLAQTLTAGANTRAFPFQATDRSRYILHFTAGKLRILRPNGTTAATLDCLPNLTLATPPSPLTTGYWDAPLRDLQLIAINDTAFITHPSTAPLRLRRLTDTSWTLDYIPFTNAPSLDENLDPNKTLTVLGNPVANAWLASATYTIGDKVFSQNAEWVALTAHTASLESEPGRGSNWKTNWRRRLFLTGEAITLTASQRNDVAWLDTFRQWEALTIVNANTGPFTPGGADVGYINPSAFRNLPTSPRPELDLPLPALWRVVEPAWSNSIYWYDESGPNGASYVVHNNTLFKCILSHDPTAVTGDEPGVGASTATYWQNLGPFANYTVEDWELAETLAIGTRILHLGRSFTVTTAHTPEPDTEPGVGVDWDDYMTETSLFVSGHAATTNVTPGSYWQVSPSRDAKDFQIEIRAISASDGLFSPIIAVDGGWNLNTFGTWSGTFILQRSIDNGTTWETIRSYQATADRNVADSGVEDTPVLMRLGFQSETGTAGSGNQRAVLTPETPAVRGTALATTYVSGSKMTGTAITALLSGQTDIWAEGAFSSLRGFPAAIGLHEKRLIFGGTTYAPATLWLSQSDDLNNFETGTDDNTSITYPIPTPALAPIRWIISQRRLIIGTSRGEWIIGSETSDQPLTPSNFLARSYTAFGTIPLQPVPANDAILFVERKGSRLRELAYTPDDTNAAGDLTRLAEHLTQPGICSLAWQQTREPALWAVTRPGTLLHLAYNRTERLSAWSRHTTPSGTFREVIVLPSDDGDDDVFFIIDRGNTSHLERLPAHWLQTLETAQTPGLPADPAWPYFYLDGIEGTGTTITVPTHLQNTPLTLLTLPGAAVVPTTTSVNYNTSPITITNARYHLGRPYTATYNSLPIDLSAQDGSTAGRLRRLNRIRLNTYRSREGTVWNASPARAQLIHRNPDVTTPLLDGWQEIVLDPGNLTETPINITHASPYPLTLRAASLSWNPQEP
jgi:hypothetical protein